jgi:hypothetical protein
LAVGIEYTWVQYIIKRHAAVSSLLEDRFFKPLGWREKGKNSVFDIRHSCARVA